MRPELRAELRRCVDEALARDPLAGRILRERDMAVERAERWEALARDLAEELRRWPARKELWAALAAFDAEKERNA